MEEAEKFMAEHPPVPIDFPVNSAPEQE
jgi:hypothetical protein